MTVSRSQLDAILTAAFGLVLVYTLWCASVGWGTPIVQQYEFVQAKAAIGAYYIAKGGPIFRYELPVFGPPWSIPYEFPVYQASVAWTHNLTGLPLESAGRIVGKVFFYLSCIPLALIARALGFRGRSVLIPVTLFLASPIYLFWSRQFMNESTATFFSLAYLAAVMAWSQSGGGARWAVALLLGIMAALSKSTTYATFGLAAGLYLAFEWIRNRSYGIGSVARGAALLLVPLISGLIWVRFTDQVKSLNPLAADAHTSAALAKWYLSSEWGERTGGAIWYHFFRITVHDAMGHRAVWILSVLVALLLRQKAWLYWLCSALFLVAPMLFTHAFLLHDYYANANAVFLVFGLAVLVERVTSSERSRIRALGIALFVVSVGYQVREFMGKGYIQQQERRMAPVTFAKKLQSIVAPEEVLLMYGEDWCPVIPYQAGRRAIMMQLGRSYNPRLSESLALLQAEGRRIGAVVFCHDARADADLLRRVGPGPLLLRDLCDVYAYQPARAPRP